ncbi:ubiquitin-2 like Rad60 SUMO-like-domain-containing protein [Mariannaea sp. PMI_226]|nr:ubiquitin-2 like Rad60 SUMO-like-domain-containing protein [Mariannaea sp. PMI_226]
MTNDFLASPPKKKLPFKPTALRRAAAAAAKTHDSDDDGLSLFRRSKEMAPIVAADRERRLKRKQKQRELEEQRQTERRMSETERPTSKDEQSDGPNPRHEPRSDDTETQDADSSSIAEVPLDHPPTTSKEKEEEEEDRASELVTPPPSKRSRFSPKSSRKQSEPLGEEEEGEEAAEPSPSPSARRFLRSYICPESSANKSPQRASPIRLRSSQKESFNPRNAPIISLDSDSDNDVPPARPAPARRRSSSSEVEVLKASQSQPSASQPSPSQSHKIDPPEDDEFSIYVRRAEEQRARNEALMRSNAGGSSMKETTEMYISSVIPGVAPVVVKFPFDKPLRVVRETWVAIQKKKGVEIPTDNLDEVLLTWRHKKVYNYSTLLSLGIRPQGDGRLIADTFGRTGFSDSRTRVHLEAWTPELFQQMEQAEDLRRRREAGELSDDEEEAPQEEEVPEVKLKIILKSRDLGDVKLTIRPETTVETLITGFRTQLDVPTNKDVSLWFDGDRLEEHTTMIDAEIDDMDTIEVHVK